MFAKPLIAIFAFSLLACGLSSEAAAQRIELRGRLASTGVDALASGNAKFERRADRVRFSAEAEDMRTTTQIRVFVGGKFVGAVPVRQGFADLNLDSRLGHSVPNMAAGDVVTVFNQKGQMILRGVLRSR